MFGLNVHIFSSSKCTDSQGKSVVRVSVVRLQILAVHIVILRVVLGDDRLRGVLHLLRWNVLDGYRQDGGLDRLGHRHRRGSSHGLQRQTPRVPLSERPTARNTHDGLDVDVRPGLDDDGVEAVDRVRRVVDRPHGTVRFDQAVLPLDDVTVPVLRLLFDVPRVGVVHSVVKTVLRVGLRENNMFRRGNDFRGGGGAEPSAYLVIQCRVSGERHSEIDERRET